MADRDRSVIPKSLIDISNFQKVNKALKRLQFENPGPLMRQPPSTSRDSRLRRRENQPQLTFDVCDCLEVECPGCFLPCSKCRSNKCGVECRRGRGWDYAGEIDRDFITTNTNNVSNNNTLS